MKKLAMIIFVVFLTLDAFAAVRGMEFGWSIGKVRGLETEGNYKSNYLAEEGTLYVDVYEGVNLLGIRAKLYYTFYKGRLMKISYVFNELYFDSSKYIHDFLFLYNALVEKYGEPTNLSLDRGDYVIEDTIETLGKALAVGNLDIKIGWELQEQLILLYISKPSLRTNYGLDYLCLPMREEQLKELGKANNTLEKETESKKEKQSY